MSYAEDTTLRAELTNYIQCKSQSRSTVNRLNINKTKLMTTGAASAELIRKTLKW